MESSIDSLVPLQKKVLILLADFDPPFILGGGALAIYIGHRQTRDLDLFWEEIEHFAEHPRAIRRRLEVAGLSVSTLQESPTFVRFRVTDQSSSINLDLVADPTDRLERPSRLVIEHAEFAGESLARSAREQALCAAEPVRSP